MNTLAESPALPMLVSLATLVAKVTLVFALAFVGARIFRRTTADIRHAVWVAALVGAITLPVLNVALPAWNTPLPLSRSMSVADGAGFVPAIQPVAHTPFAVQRAAQPQASRDPARATGLPAAPSSRAASALAIVTLVWLVGALAVVALVMFGRRGMQTLLHSATELTDDVWTSSLATAARRMQVNRTVRIYRARGATIPVTWGWKHPVVLLPADATEWGVARRRVVLEHELAHIARNDCVWEHLAWLACAVWWFHPLAWRAARRLRTERERACDDCVLQAGTPATEYATHLVDVAASASAPGRHMMAALAMATRGALEGRVTHMLDVGRARSPISRRMWLLVSTVALFSVGGIASARAAQSGKPTPLFSKKSKAAPSDSVMFEIASGASIDWSGIISAGDTVSVRSAQGNITVDSGTAEQVTMSATRRTGPRGRQADTRVAVVRRGHAVTICAVYLIEERSMGMCEADGKWGRGSVDDNDVSFRVTVPAGVHVNLMTGLGDLRAEHVHGRVRALTGNGDAVIANDRSANVEAYSGRIQYTLLSNSDGDSRKKEGCLYLSGSKGQPCIPISSTVTLKVLHGGIGIAFAPERVGYVSAFTDAGVVQVDPALSVFSGGDMRTSACTPRDPKREIQYGEKLKSLCGNYESRFQAMGGPPDKGLSARTRITATLEKGNIRIDRIQAR